MGFFSKKKKTNNNNSNPCTEVLQSLFLYVTIIETRIEQTSEAVTETAWEMFLLGSCS